MKHLKAERERLGISVEKLADVMGVHPNTVRGWEHDEFEPTGRNLVQLSSIFGCDADYLLDLTEQRSRYSTASHQLSSAKVARS
nr:MAG TPA: helix-turn-helix protein [Caudoviricetes sp.]